MLKLVKIFDKKVISLTSFGVSSKLNSGEFHGGMAELADAVDSKSIVAIHYRFKSDYLYQ